jgi:hypothetical protein
VDPEAAVSAAAAESPPAVARREAGDGDATVIRRCLCHLLAGNPGRRHFPPQTLAAIQHAVAAGERRHRGEICFAIEDALPWRAALANLGSRERARQVFAQLRVWDTRDDSGVLVYVLLADHAIEIVADRGIAAKVAESEWIAICAQLREHFVAGDWEQGALEAVASISDLLAAHFPVDDRDNPDELSNRPVLL